jgi:hypothetical protein
MTTKVDIETICKKTWLTEKEAEEYMGIRNDVLRRFRERGSDAGILLPYIRIGEKIIRYRRRDIDDFLLKHKPEKLKMV